MTYEKAIEVLDKMRKNTALSAVWGFPASKDKCIEMHDALTIAINELKKKGVSKNDL